MSFHGRKPWKTNGLQKCVHQPYFSDYVGNVMFIHSGMSLCCLEERWQLHRIAIKVQASTNFGILLWIRYNLHGMKMYLVFIKKSEEIATKSPSIIFIPNSLTTLNVLSHGDLIYLIYILNFFGFFWLFTMVYGTVVEQALLDQNHYYFSWKRQFLYSNVWKSCSTKQELYHWSHV